MWVSIKYERLQSFCYKCGVVGHDFKGCNKEVAVDEKGNRVYGAWIIAQAQKDLEASMTKFSDD